MAAAQHARSLHVAGEGGYPKREETERPYRLWDAKEKAPVPYRNYKYHKNAHIGALLEIRWAKVGTTYEVYNCLNGRLLAQYTRHPTTISFLGA